MDNMVGNMLSFIIGALSSGGVFALFYVLQIRRQERRERIRHEAISDVGRLCAAIESSISAYRLGKLDFSAMRDTVLARIDEVASMLNQNEDTLDAYYIRYIERFVEDQKRYLMGRDASARQGNPQPTVQETPAAVSPMQQSAPASAPVIELVPASAAIVALINEAPTPASAAEAPSLPPVLPEPMENEPPFVPPPQAAAAVSSARSKAYPPVLPEVSNLAEDSEEYSFEQRIAVSAPIQAMPPVAAPAAAVNPFDAYMPSNPVPTQAQNPAFVSMQTQSIDFAAVMANEQSDDDNYFGQTPSTAGGNIFGGPSHMEMPKPITAMPPPPIVTPSIFNATPAAKTAFETFDVEATQEFNLQDVRRIAGAAQADAPTGEWTPEGTPVRGEGKTAAGKSNDLVTGDEVMGQLDNLFSSWGK